MKITITYCPWCSEKLVSSGATVKICQQHWDYLVKIGVLTKQIIHKYKNLGGASLNKNSA